MQIGMIGLGRMGSNMVRRLMRGGHECVVFDRSHDAVVALEKEGAVGARSLDEFVQKMTRPRAVWMMVPAGVVDSVIQDLARRLAPGDTMIDGGNSYYVDDLRRAQQLEPLGIHYVDAGTSGGVFGLERGYCLMIGGEREAVERLDPVFRTLAPGRGDLPATEGLKSGTAQEGYLHCGPPGAGHFVKMVHNGVEYGFMASLAEGLNILQHADVGKQARSRDAETAPLRHPERYQYEFDLAAVAEVWRRGSVIASWLLDLTAAALAQDANLSKFAGDVSDSGEGRWTVTAAVEEGAPAPVLSTALFQRFSSRGEADYANKLLSAMRFEFGGHVEKTAGGGGE